MLGADDPSGIMSVTRLPLERLMALNHAIYELYHQPEESSPLGTVLGIIERLVPHTWSSVDEVCDGGSMIHHAGRHCELWPADMGEALTRLGHTSPIIAAGFVPAVKLSDLCTLRQFRQTPYFGEFMVNIPSFRDQAALVVHVPDGGRLGFCLSHERPFCGEDLLILQLLQPHVQSVLARYLRAPLPAQPPLTPREREVLHWLAEGKRDAEIGLILKTRERTIKQHVRAILRKFAVETRTTAAAIAWRARLYPTSSSFADSVAVSAKIPPPNPH